MSLETLLEPFRFSFMIRAFPWYRDRCNRRHHGNVCGTRVWLHGDAIAHTAFTGSGAAFKHNLYAGAAFALMTALVVTSQGCRVKAMRLWPYFTGFAVGDSLVRHAGFAGDLSSLLLGSVMAIQVNGYIIAVTALPSSC